MKSVLYNQKNNEMKSSFTYIKNKSYLIWKKLSNELNFGEFYKFLIIFDEVMNRIT